MIKAIIVKELTEYRRDRRVLGILCLISLLVLVSLITGWSTHAEQERQARQAQRDDQETFLKQPEKNPHAAAHFGRMAYKHLPALSVFDPGAAPYLGQVIWLEAHRQDPAMFRPAEDSPELSRLADLSVAGVLTILLPLLIFLLGYGSFAAERERGTLRQIMSAGAGGQRLFAGKITAVGGLGTSLASVAIVVSIALALMAPSSVSVWDTIIRGAGLILAYGFYGLVFASIALFISARIRTAQSALLILLSVWTVSVVILPRVAASAAELIYPSPNANDFWTQTSAEIRANKPNRNSKQYRAIEQRVLSQALDREVTAEELVSMDLNRQGLGLEVSERLCADVYTAAYRTLYATYNNQQRIRRLFAILSPAIVLQHVSSALAGNDISAHRHFALQAEQQRSVVIRKMNEDMMLNGAGQSYRYLAGSDLWASIPDFVYEAPSVLFAVRSAAWDFLILVSWSVIALYFAWQSAGRQRVI